MIASFTPRLGLSTLALVGLATLAGLSISASTAEEAHKILPPAYIVINDLPKIQALKRLFPELYRADPVLVAASSHASGCLMCRE
ncbi:MAG TPA: hypothetical protein VJY34_17835 [Roseiarcus sp.]|nr:hypothetical protein [Roseiarcus sp.]